METNNTTPQTESTSLHKMHHSKIFIWIVLGLTQLIIIIAVFALGVSVGFHKARFTYSWSNNYPSNFGQPGSKALLQISPPAGQFFNAHGLDGTILTKNTGGVVIKDEDSTEKTILISSTTTIREGSQNIRTDSLQTGQEIVVIGEANDQGQIQAKFIRVLN